MDEVRAVIAGGVGGWRSRLSGRATASGGSALLRLLPGGPTVGAEAAAEAAAEAPGVAWLSSAARRYETPGVAWLSSAARRYETPGWWATSCRRASVRARHAPTSARGALSAGARYTSVCAYAMRGIRSPYSPL